VYCTTEDFTLANYFLVLLVFTQVSNAARLLWVLLVIAFSLVILENLLC